MDVGEQARAVLRGPPGDDLERRGRHAAPGADEAGGLAPEGDVPLLQHSVHVEGHLLLVPLEAQLHQVPPVGLVRRRAVGGAAGAEEAHPAVLGELELRDALVHLVALAEDEVPRVGVLVVGAHVKGHRVGAEVAVEDRRVLALGVVGERGGLLGVGLACLRRGQLQRHPEVRVVAALEEEREGRAGRADGVVEAVLVVVVLGIGLPQAEAPLLEALREAHLRRQRRDGQLTLVVSQLLAVLVLRRQLGRHRAQRGVDDGVTGPDDCAADHALEREPQLRPARRRHARHSARLAAVGALVRPRVPLRRPN